MLSRTANALNWMARYVERAEAGARLAEVNLHLSLDLAGAQGTAWDAVIETTGDLKAFRERYGEATRETALRFLVLDEENPNSVGQCVRWARENARTVREHLPGEAWELLNSVYLALGTHAGGEPGRLDALLDLVKDRARELEGLLAGSLSRDEGWHFVQVGRFL
ncbi:MAG TPA: alpha-E domain-containing protein, partial [bacterium]|nr:alpha-E domain-containing protein [bacterium]